MNVFVTTVLYRMRKIKRSCPYTSVGLLVKHWITWESLSVHVYLLLWNLPAFPLQHACNQITRHNHTGHWQILLSTHQLLLYHSSLQQKLKVVKYPFQHAQKCAEEHSSSPAVPAPVECFRNLFSSQTVALQLCLSHSKNKLKNIYVNCRHRCVAQEIPPINHCLDSIKGEWLPSIYLHAFRKKRWTVGASCIGKVCVQIHDNEFNSLEGY